MKCISTLFLTEWGDYGKSGPVEPPVKFWLWALNLKNRPLYPFKVPIVKTEYTKKCCWRAFPTEHNCVTDYYSYVLDNDF